MSQVPTLLHRLSIRIALALLVLSATQVIAGSGAVNANGTINVTVNFRFPPTPAVLTTVRDRINAASRLLYDATEGQLRIGQVQITCGSVNEDLADFWLFAQPMRSNSPIDALGVRGAHINQYFGDMGEVFAHEFGHLGFGLDDEYTENQTACGGAGWCIEENPMAATEQSQCLMQQTPGLSWSEFCTAANHDQLRGDNLACRVNPPDADGAPCTQGCERWNTKTRRYESGWQQPSCWESLVAKFPFLTAPVGLPAEVIPAGFVDPVFVESCQGASRVLLLLDRSGSMGWNVRDDWGEVCGNGIDDDGDGVVDENLPNNGCAQARIEFVRAAARSFLALSGLAGHQLGIVSFNQAQTNETLPLGGNFVDVAPNLAMLQNRVDNLSPGGLTAIGDVLTYGKTLFDADPTPAASKAALMITDGQNTAGSPPATSIPDYRAAGIRVYAISTGEASDDATLTDIATATRGIRLDSRDGTALVIAVIEQWSNYMNGGVLVPRTPYVLSGLGTAVPTHKESTTAALPHTQTTLFHVEPGTRRVTLGLAGDMNVMKGFGVRVRLFSPSGTMFDSATPSSQLQVVSDHYFLLLALAHPETGDWRLDVMVATGAAPVQTGKLIVVTENPRTDLFLDADRQHVTSSSDVVTATLLPSYVTGLRDVDWKVVLVDPVGAVVPVAVQPGSRPFVYYATLSGFAYSGVYELRATLRTRAGSTNDPGETRPGKAPPNSVPVPYVSRTERLQIYADIGRWPGCLPPVHRGDSRRSPRPKLCCCTWCGSASLACSLSAAKPDPSARK